DQITHTVGTGSVTFKITVTNKGSADVKPATFSDNTPGAGGLTWTCTASGGASCPIGSGTGNINNASVDLPNGGSVVFNVTVTSGSNLTNTATITSNVTDPNPADNTQKDGPVSVI
ncbi:MAG: hypothetical protein ACXV7I_15560, partial [Ilumatobacteraceae bacterium]